MDWRLKGTIQKVLGVLPGGDVAHYWLQRSASGVRGSRYFDSLPWM